MHGPGGGGRGKRVTGAEGWDDCKSFSGDWRWVWLRIEAISLKICTIKA